MHANARFSKDYVPRVTNEELWVKLLANDKIFRNKDATDSNFSKIEHIYAW